MVSGDANSKTMKTARVAIWSVANGQDDLTWLTIPLQNNQGRLSIDVSKLPAYTNPSEYTVHTYITYDDGSQVGTSLGNLQFATPSLSSNVQQDSAGVYTVTIENVPANIESVILPVWSDNGGQDDLKWYRAQSLGNGRYSIKVDVANHKYTSGHYQVHIYGKNSQTGQTVGLAATSGFDYVSGKTNAVVQVQNYKKDSTTFDVTLSRQADTQAIKGARVAVWS